MQNPQSSGFGFFLLTTFAAGLAAIFTPCVFPMIPFTVSYFINRNSASKRDGIVQAIVFCVGVIVFFTGLGLITKAIAGPIGVVKLGNSPWVNGFIGLVFIVFGLSLLGAFELTLPSGLPYQIESGLGRRRIFRHADHGPDVHADFFRLHRTDRGSAAGGFGANRRNPTGARHGVVRYWIGASVFRAGVVSLLLEEAAEERRLADARESGAGIYRAGGLASSI